MKWTDLHNEKLFTVESTEFSRERFTSLIETMNPEALEDYSYGDHLRVDTAEWFYKHKPKLKGDGNFAHEVRGNHNVINRMTNLSEMRQLKTRTVSNRYGSMVATKHLEKAIDQMPEEVKEKMQDQQSKAQERADCQKALDAIKQFGEANGTSEQLEEQVEEKIEELGEALEKEAEANEAFDQTMEENEDGIRSALRSSLQEANEEMEENENMVKAFTGAPGAGSGGNVTPEEMVRMVSLAEQNEELKHIAEIAGRLQHITRETTQTNAERHTGEITDVTLGKKINNLTGSEKARLAHPIARKAVQARIIDNKAMVWKKEDRDNLGKGPIILAVDNSGSMNGSHQEPLKRPIIWAKGVALALYRLASDRKQPFHYLHWGGNENELDGETFYGKRGEELEVMRHSLRFFCGGNDLPSTWKYLQRMLLQPEWKKADVITITDAVETIDEKDYSPFLETLKSVEGQSYGIYLNDRDTYLKEIEKYCDRVWLCRPSGSDDVLKELVHDLTKTGE